jgi:hypothetical protein
LSRSIATRAGQRSLDGLIEDCKKYVCGSEYPKEIKALADTVLEKEILWALAPMGFIILSEESGYIPSQKKT